MEATELRFRRFGLLGLKLYHYLYKLRVDVSYWFKSDVNYTRSKYKKVFGFYPNLDSPKTLTEKLQWIKLNEKSELRTMVSDKYAVREYLRAKFGDRYLVPLLYETTDYKLLTEDTIPNVHCIVKANHDCAHYRIIRDKRNVDYSELREMCRFWMSINYYKRTREWQYKNIKPRIIIEKLLESKTGKIPNDYKLEFINGELQFIYVSVDREGKNDRCTFDRNWNRLPFVWMGPHVYRSDLNTTEVPQPVNLKKMIEMGEIIASDFSYVRVDYYEVDGELYFGEITLIHGAGFDKFYPEEYDRIFGEKLNLNHV